MALHEPAPGISCVLPRLHRLLSKPHAILCPFVAHAAQAGLSFPYVLFISYAPDSFQAPSPSYPSGYMAQC